MPTSTSVSRVIGEGFRRAFVVTSAGLLTLLDFSSLLVAGWLTEEWLWSFSTAPTDSPGVGWSVRYLLAVAALLAAIMFYDKQFGARARRGDWSALVRSYVTGFLLFVGGVLVIGGASGVLGTIPSGAVASWLALSFLLASLARLVLISGVRRLMRRGVLTEVVAIVGAGSLADRLTQDLRNSKWGRMQVLGVFDDGGASAQAGHGAVVGTIDDLLELGKTRHLDWIFVNPCVDEQRLASVVGRLKALAVPIALCPWNVGLGTPYQTIDYVGGALPVTVLVDRPARRWRAATQTACQFLPRWITTLLVLPLSLVGMWWPARWWATRASSAAESPWDPPLETGLRDSFWEAGVLREFGERLRAESAAGDRGLGSFPRGDIAYDVGCDSTALAYNETPTTNASDRFTRGGLSDPDELDDYLLRAGSGERSEAMIERNCAAPISFR